MPCVQICTNVCLDGVDTDSIFSDATKAVSQIIGRPEQASPNAIVSWETDECHLSDAVGIQSSVEAVSLVGLLGDEQLMKFVMVILKGSVAISFEKNKEPAAFAEIISMGGITSEVKKKLIFQLGTILLEKLSVPRTRFFVKVFDTTMATKYSKL